MPAISVIVPYYNDNLDAFNSCIKSIKRQTFPDYEVLIINDGSDKKYRQRIESIISGDIRFRIIDQINSGVSIARNNGTAQAKGKYITYVDADDIITPYFFEEAFFIAEKNQADVLYSYIFRTCNEKYQPEHNNQPRVQPISEQWIIKYEAGYTLVQKSREFGRGCWARLIRADIAKDTLFPKNTPIMEDILWNIELARKSLKTFLVDQIWYIYIKRNESVTCKYDENIINKISIFLDKLPQYLRMNTEEKQYYYNRLLMCLKRYVFRQYLGHPNNPSGYFSRYRDFHKICATQPWSMLNESKVYKILDKRNRIKVLLLRVGLLFPIWSVRNMWESRSKEKSTNK